MKQVFKRGCICSMRVAFVNTYDVKDIKKWSGIPYHISLMLENKFNFSISYFTVPLKRNLLSKSFGLYFNKIKKKKYITWADPLLLKSNEASFKKIKEQKFDLIITFQFFLVSFLCNKKTKIIFWNDATFQNLHNFYPYVTNVCNFCLKGGDFIQRKALEECNHIILSSDWAINSVVDYYGISKDKVTKIFFASNLTKNATVAEIEDIITLRKIQKIKLLFLSVDWKRKGGDDAVSVLKKLNESGIEAELYVAGTDVPEAHRNNNRIVSYGFINKNTPEGENKLILLLKESTFLILPTRADCTPVVFSEANSFALPVLTTCVGGIASVINDNENGCCFRVDNFVEMAHDYILRHLPQSDAYEQLCKSSYLYYLTKLSWQATEKNFKEVLESLQIDKSCYADNVKHDQVEKKL